MARPRPPRHVRIFLASPGDVKEERGAAREVLERLERDPLVRRDYTIEVVSWDDPDAPAPMLATLTPQEAVARALPLPSECDLTVVILWGRMGTPLEERKADGSPYRSGTEWEFEDARRANKPILLYRRTPPPTPGEGDEEGVRQDRGVKEFFEQFEGPRGTLRGGFTLYGSTEELRERLRKDVASLLPTVPRTGEPLPPDAGLLRRAEARVRAWRAGRLILTLALGVALTIVAWTAVGAFAAAAAVRDAPAVAYVFRYLLMALGAAVPVALLVLTWWWLGRERLPAPD